MRRAQFERSDAARAELDAGPPTLVDRAVGGDHQVDVGEQGAVGAHAVADMGAAYLFLALQQDDDVAGQAAGDRQPRLDRQKLGQMLPLVVAHAPPPDAAVAYFRLEWRRYPGFQRIGRLHVVVAVEQRRRRLRTLPVAAVYERPARAFQQLCLHAQILQVAEQKVSRLPDADPVGADAGLGYIGQQAVDKLLLEGVHVSEYLGQAGGLIVRFRHRVPPERAGASLFHTLFVA